MSTRDGPAPGTTRDRRGGGGGDGGEAAESLFASPLIQRRLRQVLELHGGLRLVAHRAVVPFRAASGDDGGGVEDAAERRGLHHADAGGQLDSSSARSVVASGGDYGVERHIEPPRPGDAHRRPPRPLHRPITAGEGEAGTCHVRDQLQGRPGSRPRRRRRSPRSESRRPRSSRRCRNRCRRAPRSPPALRDPMLGEQRQRVRVVVLTRAAVRAHPSTAPPTRSSRSRGAGRGRRGPARPAASPASARPTRRTSPASPTACPRCAATRGPCPFCRPAIDDGERVLQFTSDGEDDAGARAVVTRDGRGSGKARSRATAGPDARRGTPNPPRARECRDHAAETRPRVREPPRADALSWHSASPGGLPDVATSGLSTRARAAANTATSPDVAGPGATDGASSGAEPVASGRRGAITIGCAGEVSSASSVSPNSARRWAAPASGPSPRKGLAGRCCGGAARRRRARWPRRT